MREHLSKIIIIGLLVAIVGVPILLRPAGGAADASEDSPRLVIYTPHNEQIRHEIEHAFNDYRVANNLPAVVFDWRTPGGTSDIRKSILSQYNALVGTEDGLDKGIGVDLFFGGGEYDHGKIAGGLEIKDDQDNKTYQRIVIDPQIDPALFREVFPQPRLGGERLYREYTFIEDGEETTILGWTGVTLSSFGIVYNNDTIRMLGIDAPTTWADLTDPKLRGWVALADPGHSGSISATFETILRREGWNEGWRTLRMAFANARYFATSSDRVPVDVSRGDAAVGMCIDFYGRYQAGAVGDGRVSYVDPVVDGQSMTATTADPITLLRGAPSAPLARDFIAWLLMPDAQSLWQRAKSNTDDGLVRPDKYELRRQPIRADLYTDASRASWVDRELDPLATAVPFPEGTPSYFALVAPVTKAMAIDVHGDLVRAWEVLNRAKAQNHPNAKHMEKLFFAVPPQLQLEWDDKELARDWRAIHYNPDHPRHGEVVDKLKAFAEQLAPLTDRDDPEVAEANRIRWRAFFQRNYREIVELGRD